MCDSQGVGAIEEIRVAASAENRPVSCSSRAAPSTTGPERRLYEGMAVRVAGVSSVYVEVQPKP